MKRLALLLCMLGCNEAPPATTPDAAPDAAPGVAPDVALDATATLTERAETAPERVETPPDAAIPIDIDARTTPRTDASSPTSVIRTDARPREAARPRRDAGALDDRAGMMAELRRRFYERQARLQPPAALPNHIRALLPPALQRKTVAVQLHRQMADSKPRPGHARYMVRWLTLARGPALLDPLQQQLRALGWKPAAQRGRWIHPTLGRLSIEVEQPEERPSRIEMVIDHGADRPPLEKPDDLLSEVPDWLAQLDSTLLGYEFGHFHARGPGSRYTDLQRLALTVRPPDPEVFDRALATRLLAAGYARDADTPRLFRKEGDTLASQRLDDGYFVLHHQRRWKR